MSYAKNSPEYKRAAHNYHVSEKEEGFEYMHISALPKNPSTFWRKRGSEKWYLTKKAAAIGGDDNVNPSSYAIEKSFWVKNKKTVIVCGCLVVLFVVAFWAFRSGALQYRSGRFMQ